MRAVLISRAVSHVCHLARRTHACATPESEQESAREILARVRHAGVGAGVGARVEATRTVDRRRRRVSSPRGEPVGVG